MMTPGLGFLPRSAHQSKCPTLEYYTEENDYAASSQASARPEALSFPRRSHEITGAVPAGRRSRDPFKPVLADEEAFSGCGLPKPIPFELYPE